MKIAKLESDLLKTNEDITPQNREILQTLVCPSLLHSRF